MSKKQRKGFAMMDPEDVRYIARRGGLAVSRDRKHMAMIGAKGGANSHNGGRKD